MKYGLNSNGVGTLIDRTPILSDVRGEFNIYFDVPRKQRLFPDIGCFVAVYKGASGVEYRVKVDDNGVCPLPKELLRIEQYVEVTLYKTDGDEILNKWKCEPLKLKNFNALRRPQWEVSAGMTEKDALTRMADLEQAYSDFRDSVNQLKLHYSQAHEQALGAIKTLKQEHEEYVALRKETQDRLLERLSKVEGDLAIQISFNKTETDKFNELAQKVYALEKNYCPSQIE